MPNLIDRRQYDPRLWGAKCDQCPLAGTGWAAPTGPGDAPLAFVGEGPGKMEVARGEVLCLVPETLVLMGDLNWRRLGDIKVGDEIIAFDEDAKDSTGVSGRGMRKLKFANVTAVHRKIAATVRVDFDDGQHLIGTPDHRIMNGSCTGGYSKRWRRLDQLQVTGGKTGRRSRAVSISTWEPDASHDGGWLAGLFDGEGWVAGSKKQYRKGRGYVGFSQNEGAVYRRAIELIHGFGFDTRQSERTPAGRGDRFKYTANHYRTTLRGGLMETLRFLGRFRPIRLVEDFRSVLRVRDGIGMRFTRFPRSMSRVDSGTREVIDISTTAGTFFANGYAVHNCGPSGAKLNEMLYTLKVRRDQVWATNTILCRPSVPGLEGKRKFDVKTYVAWFRKQNAERKKNGWPPQLSPFECCRPRLLRELNMLEAAAVARGSPNGVVVMPMGNFALDATTVQGPEGKKPKGILKYRGSVLPIEGGLS